MESPNHGSVASRAAGINMLAPDASHERIIRYGRAETGSSVYNA